MTTKYLHGAYPGGYTLSAAYTGLNIEATATVGGAGVDVASFATIQNDGVVNATNAGRDGITLHAGGIVTNGSATDVTALIEGDSGIYCGNGKSLVLANFGTISGSARYGVVLYGGSVTNGSATDTTALIEGNRLQGIWAGGPSSDTITNFGTIKSVSNDGVILLAGGIVTNGSATDTTALIEGSTGILDTSSNTITNFGTIAGIGAAVSLNSADVLQVEAGCVFQGAVLGGGGTLDLASGVGTISGLSGGNVTVSGSMAPTNFTNFGTLEIAGGATFTLAGTGTIASGGTGALIDDGALAVTGSLTVAGSLTVSGTISGAGTVALSGAAFVEIDSAVTSTLSMTFESAATATLALKDPAQFAATIAGFAGAGRIDLINTAATSAVLNGSDQLVITNGTTTVATLQLTGTYTGDTFTTASDGHGGTAIAVSVSTTKYLHGAYPGGYTLGAAFTGLDVQAGASVGGTGVDAAAFATVQNDGVINATAAGRNGITLHAGGIVTNGSATDVTALIEGDSGIYCGQGKSLVLANFGTISGNARYGVALYGGRVTNGSATDTTALIEGYIGIRGKSVGTTSIGNFGTIMGASSSPGGVGVYLTGGNSGGILINGSATDSSALIEGRSGILSTGPSVTIVNYGTIEGTGGVAVVLNLRSATAVLEVEAGSAFGGAVLGGGGTLDLASGVGTISGVSGGNITVSGSMAPTNFTGFGTLEIATGASFELAGAVTIGTGGPTTLIDNGTLVVAGTVTGTGTVAFGAGAVLSGAGALTLTNATVAGLIVRGGTVMISDVGLIDQTGRIVLNKDANGARLTIASGATYKLDGDVGVALRKSDTPVIVVDGLFIKSAGRGMSSVGVVVGDNGTIEVATGTLSFIAGVSGTGLMKIDAGTTLQFANTVASTLTANFNGARGTLALSNAGVFAATISGFATGETIDLLNTAATSAVLNGGDQLVITNGTTTVATLQLTGSYAGATFAAASDGHGGTAITVSGGAAGAPVHGFVAAMAAIGPAAGAGHASGWRFEEAARPLLLSPRAALA